MAADLSKTIPSIASPSSQINETELSALKKANPKINDSQWNDINTALSSGVLSNSGRAAALKAIVAKGGLNVDNSTITGSGKVGIDKSVDSANSNASSTMNPDPAIKSTVSSSTVGFNPSVASTVIGTIQNPDGTNTVTLANGVTATTTLDPIAQSQITTLNSEHNTQLSQLEQEKAHAVAAASAAYDKGSPGSADSQKQEYIASVVSSYDANIENLNNTYQDNLNTIHANVQSNARADFSNSIANLPGDAPLSQTTFSTLLGQALSAGMDPVTAQVQIENAQQNASIAYNKTMTAQDKATAATNRSLLLPALAQLSTPWEQLSPDQKTTYENLAIQAGVGVPSNKTISQAIADGSVDMKQVDAYLSTQTKGLQAATKLQNDQLNAETRLAIAEQNANTSTNKATVSDVTTTLTNLKTNNPAQLTQIQNDLNAAPKDPAAASRVKSEVAGLAQFAGTDVATMVSALQYGLGIKSNSKTTVTSTPSLTNLYGLLPDSKTTVTTTGENGGDDSMYGVLSSGISYTVVQ